ncbi:ketose-bisphosphate aldolase [Streptomyces sp. NPDC004111]|uniref:ketose-bisphosphate aldolase n=1 Tax=Streptomyces sp. NPDC004111 TaxID=3364690 RepID=UPI0036C3F415
MLLSGQAILAPAHDHAFSVPAFNVSDYAMLKGLVEVCEELRSPLIVAIHPDELAHVGVDFIPAAIAWAHRATVPVTIHLDHGADVDQVLTAIQAGFTSVMIDGSLLPFDENIALTKEVTRIAHAVGVSVEGELGTIGKLDEQAEEGASEIIYTDPEDARRFVAETGVDSLAIAIGTSHGLYPATMTPELRLDLLEKIKETVDIPLVLHGGSGNPDKEIAGAVERGINKINISSDIKVAYHRAMREVLVADPSLREPNLIQPLSLPAMKKVAEEKIRLFQADGKADLY